MANPNYGNQITARMSCHTYLADNGDVIAQTFLYDGHEVTESEFNALRDAADAAFDRYLMERYGY